MHTPTDSHSHHPGRRRFLSRVIAVIIGAISGAVGVVLGGAVGAPGMARREDAWLPAASLDDLRELEPQAVTVRMVRQDGYREVVDRKIVFLVRQAQGEVTALDSTCTHLGCRVEWDASTQELKCPCHGGVYERSGAVKSGPPPSPLPVIACRVADGRVMVRIR